MDKLFAHLSKRLASKGHVVICVAEGAGQVGLRVIIIRWAVWVRVRVRVS